MRHPDFDKIYAQFQTRYCTGEDEDKSLEGGSCPEGQNLYTAWLTQMSLDETKPYSPEDQFSESFGWAKTLITRLKEEDGVRLYKVDACFPLSSMNRNVYTEEELIQAARMLKLVTPNLNHTDYELPFTIEGAQYEEGAVELLVSTSMDEVCPMGYKYVDMLEHSEDVPEEHHIIHVSIEGDCIGTEETDDGNACVGLGFTGIAFLTKKVLPGIPLTRIVPVERIMEHLSFSPSDKGESPMSEEKNVETDETNGPRTDDERAKAHFEIVDEDWDALTDEEKQGYIDKLPPRGSGEKLKLKSEQVLADPDATVTVEDRLDWLEYDVSYIRDDLWALREAMDIQFNAVGKRIDDALVLLTGVKVSAEATEEEEPEPVCGDCTHYVDGKCEEDDTEKDAGSECDKAAFTPKAEPTGDEEIAEPFSDYDDMDDCIAKNQDKDDPAAYCASIKKQAEEPDEEEATSEEEEQDTEESEATESGEETTTEEVEEAIEVPTKSEYIERYNELKKQGKSARDAWRLAGFEMIEHLQNK